MKNKFFVFLIFFWFLIFVNTVGAVVKNHQGTGDLYLSDKLIDEYFNYINQKSNKLPLVFFITEDKENSYFSIINNDGGGWAGSGTILKKKNKCEKKFNQKCNLFSNVRYIVWDNGINPLKQSDSKIDSNTSKEELILILRKLGFIIDQNKLSEEKAAQEKRLAEEKAAKEKRLAEEKAAKEKRLAEEKLKEEEINRKLSLFKETELEKSQKLIKYTKEFVKTYPDEFDIVEIAKLFLSVDEILKGNLNSADAKNLENLKKFTSKSKKFKNYEKQLLKKDREKKIEVVDTSLNNLGKNIDKLKEFLVNNITSSYSKEIIELIEESEKRLKDYKNLQDLNNQTKKIDILLSKINEFERNILTLNKYLADLEDYLLEFMSTELSPKIIEQIEKIEKSLNETNSSNLNQLIKETEVFIQEEIINFEKKQAEEKRKEEERIEEEKRKEKERLAEEKRKEKERLAEEKRKEKERLAEEKRKEKERLAEKKRKEEDLKLQETYKKYKIDLNNEFQKDIIKLGLNNNFQFDDISFLRNDRIIKISNLRSNELKIGNIELKDFNKNIYGLIKNGFDDNLLNDLFKTKNWFSKLVISNMSYNDTRGTKVDIQEFSIDDFQLNGYEKYKDEIFNTSLKNDELNYISALLSLNIGNYSVKNLKYKSNFEEYSFDLTEFDNFSFTNTDKSTTVNYRYNDVKNNLSIFYKEANLDNFSLDQKQIVKLLNSINTKNLDLFSSPGILLNSFSELENINIEDLIVEELNSKRKIFSLKNFEITDIEFEKPSNKDQKILSNLEFNVNDLEMVGMDKFYPDFSNYMKKLSYSKIGLNTAGKWYWNVNDDEFGLNLNIGLTDAFSLNFTSEYSGLSSDFLNLNSDAMGVYFLTNFKINEAELSLQDKSLRNRLIRMFSLETNKSEAQVKNMAISNIRNYSATMRQSNLTREYEKSIINFIDGDDEIKFKLKPKTPVSIAEITPYFQNGDADLLAEKLNLTVGN